VATSDFLQGCGSEKFFTCRPAVHLSQPTVSSHIKDLEEHFGCRLIDRLAKEALPTKAGRLLYRYAMRMIALRDEAESAMAEFKGRSKGIWKSVAAPFPERMFCRH
jgi:DNA-binding transcriptional LysR family regulator